MSKGTQIIVSLSEKIDNLLEVFNFLKKENEIISQDKFLLQQENKRLKEEVTFLQEEIKNLKIAKTFTGSEDYKKDTSAKIDFLVSEIDKCIQDLDTDAL